MVLAPLQELRSGAIWSPRRRETRPLAPSLRLALARQELEAAADGNPSPIP